MRNYIMGFNQQEACRLGISLEELLIVKWFSDFYASPKSKKIRVGGTDFMLIVKSKLIADLPILNIADRTVSRRMENLINANILVRHLETTEYGTRAYYAAGDAYDLLLDTTAHTGADVERDSAAATNVIRYCQNAFIHLTPRHYEEIESYYSDGITDEMMCFAVDTTVANGSRAWAYASRVIQGWVEAGINTIEAAKNAQIEFKSRKAKQAPATQPQARAEPERARPHEYL